MTEPTSPQPLQPVEPFPTPTFRNEQVLELGGARQQIQTEAGWIRLRKIHTPRAFMFYSAYLETNQSGRRPITFVFNGGPGAASAFLHMGSLGPKRVAFGERGSIPASPAKLVDNHETWLPFTDLVFIDPVGTGFSRALKAKSDEAAKESPDNNEDENPEYWEVDADLDSLGEFIKRFLSQHHRWTSPVFLAGESYGGFRVAKMARRLQEKHGVGVSGAMLISPAIEFASIFGSDYDLVHWIEVFPSLVASAHTHGLSRKFSADTTVETVLAAAEKFATTKLATCLAQGELGDTDAQAPVYQEIADMLGLPVELIERSAGRIDCATFCRELLRSQQRLLGRYDAAVTAVDPFPDRPGYEGPDPTLLSIDRLFAAAINHHLRRNLQVDTELDYRLLSYEVFEGWQDKTKAGAFRGSTGAMDDLRYGMSLNEHMKVMVTHGRYDLITPYFSSRRLLAATKLPESLQQNLSFHHYAGGHMYYSWDESRQAFLHDTKAFYNAALKS